MGRPVKIKESATVDVGFNNPAGGQFYGVVGGEDTLSTYDFPTLKVRLVSFFCRSLYKPHRN